MRANGLARNFSHGMLLHVALPVGFERKGGGEHSEQITDGFKKAGETLNGVPQNTNSQ